MQTEFLFYAMTKKNKNNSNRERFDFVECEGFG